MNKKSLAFTLIELLVVIVIIGILATIGIAQFNEYQEKARLAKAQAFAAQVNKKALLDHIIDDENTQVFGVFDFAQSSINSYGTTSAYVSSSENPDINLYIRDASTVTDNTPVQGKTPIDLTGSLTMHHNAGFDASKLTNGKTGMTYSLWFNLNSQPTSFQLINFELANNLVYDTDDNKLYLRDKNCASIHCAPVFIESDSFSFRTGKWYHLLLTYNDTTGQIYLDGNLIASGSTTGIDADGSYHLFFNNFSDAKIADLRFYQSFMDFNN